MSMERFKRNHLKGRVFELSKFTTDRCLEPTETCTRRAISAHSIQNARVLDRLCTDGHLIQPRLRARFGHPQVSFELVGRNEATTFAGVCGPHDDALFKDIEKSPTDYSTDEHLFLLAYRSVLRELHACVTSAVKLQFAFQAKVDLALIPGDSPTADGMLAVEHLANAYEFYLYKREYDDIYLEQKFSGLSHLRLFEPGRLPTVAVSSVFSLDNISIGDDVARIALNVLPLRGGVLIVFSFLQDHEQHIQPFLSRFQTAADDELLRRVSVQVLNSCENFVVAPSFWNALEVSKRMAMQELFCRSIGRDLKGFEASNCTLFSPAVA